jgi:hypothetical protein
MWCAAYSERVPRLWNDTIADHRRQVRDAILDTTAALIAEHGVRSVTMAQDESAVQRVVALTRDALDPRPRAQGRPEQDADQG